MRSSSTPTAWHSSHSIAWMRSLSHLMTVSHGPSQTGRPARPWDQVLKSSRFKTLVYTRILGFSIVWQTRYYLFMSYKTTLCSAFIRCEMTKLLSIVIPTDRRQVFDPENRLNTLVCYLKSTYRNRNPSRPLLRPRRPRPVLNRLIPFVAVSATQFN